LYKIDRSIFQVFSFSQTIRINKIVVIVKFLALNRYNTCENAANYNASKLL